MSITFGVLNMEGTLIWLFLLIRPGQFMNEQHPKSSADYERELRERQRLLGSNHNLPSDLDYVSHQTDEPGQYILEYLGGRRVLVEIDEASGKHHFLREL